MNRNQKAKWYDWRNVLAVQLLATLSLFDNGSYQDVAGKMHAISQATMSRVANKVSLALAELREEVIKFPSSREEQMKAMAAFYKIKKFPRGSGCIDCSHIRIKYPGGPDANTFLNRKIYCSLNIQVRKLYKVLISSDSFYHSSLLLDRWWCRPNNS
ncbi:hypothetical protein J437_LFUL017151 [Ladona fulva]|uniref:Nuclease HARBI1 n=1 Tax=Ladona fulva TaxID=123851 RepID=A0A8K0P289_LADFU|nr:hypothetical protein J437_LFUL017151 [Ladona fulva]